MAIYIYGLSCIRKNTCSEFTERVAIEDPTCTLSVSKIF